MPDDRSKTKPDRKAYSDDRTEAFSAPSHMPRPVQPHRSIPLGAMWGKYRIEAVLGRGGGGDVYAAEDTLIKRKVAIKMLPPELANDGNLLNRFMAEAQSAGRLNHPHVVTIYEIANQDGLHAIVMELVNGGSVQEYLVRKGSPGWRGATRLIGEACKALIAAHEMGLIHRDIKPANLLLTNDGKVKVADFGLAKMDATDATMHTQAGLILGTPAFMSPEQCRGDKIDQRTDIYSLGCTYYAMLTGKPPYEAPSSMQVMFAHCSAPIPDPRKVGADVPEACVAILTKALAKDANERYASAKEMFADIRAVLGGPMVTATNQMPVTPVVPVMEQEIPKDFRIFGPNQQKKKTWIQERKWIVAGAAAALVLLVGLVIFLLPSSHPSSPSPTPPVVQGPANPVTPAITPLPKPPEVPHNIVQTPPATTQPITITTQPAVVTTQPVAVIVKPPTTQSVIPAATQPLIAIVQPPAILPPDIPAQTKPAVPTVTSQPATAPAIVYDEAFLKSLPRNITNSIQLQMALVKPGKFIMGDNALADAPRHEVTITKPYYMGVVVVTKGELETVLGVEAQEPTKMTTLPASVVAWDEAVQFCQQLNDMPAEKAAGRVYRLPTEAEWEYACRAGTTTRFSFGNIMDKQHANYGKSIELASQPPPEEATAPEAPPQPQPQPQPPPPPLGPRGGRPGFNGRPPVPPTNSNTNAATDPRATRPLEPVGLYPANAWGLKEMHGGVWEWCSDFYSAETYKAGPQTDPVGPNSGTNHVARGGCWASEAVQCTSAFRNGTLDPKDHKPIYGFRVVCEVQK